MKMKTNFSMMTMMRKNRRKIVLLTTKRRDVDCKVMLNQSTGDSKVSLTLLETKARVVVAIRSQLLPQLKLLIRLRTVNCLSFLNSRFLIAQTAMVTPDVEVVL